MYRIKISDSKNLLAIACEDLEALRTVMQAMDDARDVEAGQEMLAVAARTLESIIGDIRVAVDAIDAALQEM